ncbi:hypothetical protein ACN08P_19815 [Photobacterium leiognathi subsp. mandapamensis]|uniref:hypothetical protein n=1 Tax=Photobacterium leiognathi TaxID=553611 RepID=UPI003AF3518A
MRFVIFGASSSKGKAKNTGKDYEINTMLVGRSVFEWQNDNGKCIGYGQQTTEIQFNPSEALIKKLEATAFPIIGELITELNPENPQENIVTDFKVCWSIWDANPENNKK